MHHGGGHGRHAAQRMLAAAAAKWYGAAPVVAAGLSFCEDDACNGGQPSQPAVGVPGIVITTKSVTTQLQSMMLHLHSAGIRYVCEVRKTPEANGSLSCSRDRRLHKFVEEVVNASSLALGNNEDFHYRCVDVFDERVVVDKATVSATARRIEDVALPAGVRFLAAVADSFEDLVPLTDGLGRALGVPLMGNDPATSLHRMDKFEMQEAMARLKAAKARQVRVSSSAIAVAALREAGISLPVVVKPVLSSASDGVFLCHDEAQLLAAVDSNIGIPNVFQHVKESVAVQEYLQGDEFVVNTMSLDGMHRVLDMWSAHKIVDGDKILYGHQLLVADSRQHPDVVAFALQVLDAVGVRGGASHVELVRTKSGVRLIEINPRAAGHAPRATRRVGEDQMSALVRALAHPDEFRKRAASSPHYSLAEPSKGLVMVVFMRAHRDAEVSREDLVELVSLPTFRSFDRVGVPMFADAVWEAEPHTFWVASKTVSLFTVPLTVLLAGSPEELAQDLRHIRDVESRMYRPFGTHDARMYSGTLEGGSQSRWLAAVLPKVGFRLQAYPGCQFQGSDGQVDYYKENDSGTVSSWSGDRINITWDRTGLTSSMLATAWARSFRVTAPGPEVPAVGSRLEALPGKRLRSTEGCASWIYLPGDVGTVTDRHGGQLVVTWDASGLASSVSESGWASHFRLLDAPDGRAESEAPREARRAALRSPWRPSGGSRSPSHGDGASGSVEAENSAGAPRTVWEAGAGESIASGPCHAVLRIVSMTYAPVIMRLQLFRRIDHVSPFLVPRRVVQTIACDAHVIRVHLTQTISTPASGRKSERSSCRRSLLVSACAAVVSQCV